MLVLSLSETKLASENALLADLFELGSKKKSTKIWQKNPLLGALYGVLTCLLSPSFPEQACMGFSELF